VVSIDSAEISFVIVVIIQLIRYVLILSSGSVHWIHSILLFTE